MTPSATTRSPEAAAGRRRVRPTDAAAAIGLAALFAWLQGLLPAPGHVDRVTVANPTPYAVSVEISDDGDGWVDLVTVRPGATVSVEEVVDLGGTWLVRFHAQAEEGGEARMARSELEAAGWQVTVPASVADRLAAAGAPPSP